jgi:cytoskeletal protein RodZ
LVITDSANASSTGKNFHHLIFFLIIFSSLALILYLLVAEETLVSQTAGSSSPQHDSNPTSPRIQPSSPQPEASASPRIHPASPQPEALALPMTHLASPQPDIQEPFLEPEKLPSLTREASNDVSMNTHPSIFIL